ncbi:hypothetical protein PRIC1_011823 [Phytophthora ramorum]
MARWLSFFAEYNFEVKYKSGRQNGLADALSRRPDYELSHVTTVTSSVTDLIRAAYARDDMCVALLRALGSKEFEDSDYLWLSYWWPKLYKWTSTYVRTCETCQRVKPSPHAAAPLESLPVPSGCWESMRMDFVFGLPKNSDGNTGIVVFVDRLSKMAHLEAVPDTIDGKGTAKLFIDRVFRQHGLPESIVSDRDPRSTGKFSSSVFKVLGTRLDMSTTDHPQTGGQTERVNRVVEDVLRSVCDETPKRWSTMLPLVEFALNNAVHASTGFTPFYVNGLTHPRVPLTLPLRGSGLGGGEIAGRLADVSPLTVRKQVDEFLSTRLSVLRHVREAMAESQDQQKENADARGRVSAVFKTKLRPRFIGPFKVVAKKGLAYTLNLPKKMRTHPVFYVGLLKPYRDPARVSAKALAPGRAATEPC